MPSLILHISDVEVRETSSHSFYVDLLLSFCSEMGFTLVILVDHDDGGLLALRAAQKVQTSMNSYNRILHKERQRMELASTANAKLLHECGILGDMLQECSVNFLVEEENKLIVDSSSPADAIDLLTQNRP